MGNIIKNRWTVKWDKWQAWKDMVVGVASIAFFATIGIYFAIIFSINAVKAFRFVESIFHIK